MVEQQAFTKFSNSFQSYRNPTAYNFFQRKFYSRKVVFSLDSLKAKIIELIEKENDTDLLDLVWKLLAVEGSQ